MSVRPSTRFEVFKRDDFTCQYCGRKVPQITLELDHIIPRAEGGGEEIENLTTSCAECNRGKAARPLTSRAAVEDLAAKAELLRERELQLRAYRIVQSEVREREEAEVRECWNHWFDLAGYTELQEWQTPARGIIRRYLRDLSPADVKYAMDVAFERKGLGSQTKFYFTGVLRKMLAKHEENP